MGQSVDVHIKSLNANVKVNVLNKDEIDDIYNLSISFLEDGQLEYFSIKDQISLLSCNNYYELISMALDTGSDIQTVINEMYEAVVKVNPEIDKVFSKLTLRNLNTFVFSKGEETKVKLSQKTKDKVGIKTVDFGDINDLSENLKKRVFGHDAIIDEVVDVIKCSFAGLRNPKNPRAMFLFGGTTGTGKTLLVEEIAKALFKDKWENYFIKLNGSEFMSAHEISKLIGSPPGYVGYGDLNNFVRKLRNYQNCVVLFDEIEKAHPSILNFFLQIADDGCFYDSRREKVDCSKSLFFFTTNIGTDEYNHSLGFIKSEDKIDSNMKAEICNSLRPEFINRLDGIFVFSRLKKDDILKIINLRIAELNQRLTYLKVKLTKSLKNFLADKGYSEKYGARELNRVFTKYVEMKIADYLIKNNVGCNQLKLDLIDGEVVIVSG